MGDELAGIKRDMAVFSGDRCVVQVESVTWLVNEVERLREENEFLQQDIETIVDTVAEILGLDGGDIDGDGDQGGIIAGFIRQITRRGGV